MSTVSDFWPRPPDEPARRGCRGRAATHRASLPSPFAAGSTLAVNALLATSQESQPINPASSAVPATVQTVNTLTFGPAPSDVNYDDVTKAGGGLNIRAPGSIVGIAVRPQGPARSAPSRPPCASCDACDHATTAHVDSSHTRGSIYDRTRVGLVMLCPAEPQ